MSVKVEGLTKIYGTQRAVDNVSFEVGKGQILGFLGPNGAGKSTTMKMITSFIPPTEGNIEVCGINTNEDPMAIRQKIGYLPEHNPLYLDMYVKEYLRFVAGLHQLPNKSAIVANIIERVGLTLEQNKKIGMLSKGYRQRVGLAQALLHDPEVLILDEPTSGLDPNQLVDIRHLIKTVGQEKTVILSTHIMQEVQAMCDRVVIINNGQLVADDPIEKLSSRIAGESIITVGFKGKVSKKVLEQIAGVRQVDILDNGLFHIFAKSKIDLREDIFHLAVKNNWVILEMSKDSHSVEDVFHKLTQKQTTND